MDRDYKNLRLWDSTSIGSPGNEAIESSIWHKVRCKYTDVLAC